MRDELEPKTIYDYIEDRTLACLVIARSNGVQLLLGVMGEPRLWKALLTDDLEDTRSVYKLLGDEPQLDRDGLYRVYARIDKDVDGQYYLESVSRIVKVHDGRSW